MEILAHTLISCQPAYDDDAGRQSQVWDALNHPTYFGYDALGQQVQMQYPDNTTTGIAYDADGRRVAETNQDGIVTRFGYDGAGRLTSVTNALNQATRYQYDEAGNEIAQIDALNRTNVYFYDGLGRRIQHSMPGGQTEGFAYDLAGNLIFATNFTGVIITNQYDVMNRLANQASINGYRVSYTYTATGQRQTMADPSGTTSCSYDNRDRLLLKTMNWNNGPSVSLNYTYDANGNVTGIWSSTVNGVNLVYGYDALSRLINVAQASSPAAAYAYDAVGNLQFLQYGNGVTNQYQYDSLNRLTNLVWKLNTSTLGSFYYQLGLTGNQTNLIETINNGASRNYQWQYDKLYRLTNEVIGAIGKLGYAYDPVGNRTNRQSSISQLPTVAYGYNTNDWLTTDQYDANGNTTNSATIFYQYDALNHLTNVNNGAIVLTYDGDGNRVSKKVGSTTTYYLLDDRNPSGFVQVVEEWTSTGIPSLSKVYNFGLSLISQRQVSGVTVSYYGCDGHGSTRFLTGASGTITDTYTYDAYGTLIAQTYTGSPTPNNYLYAGQQWDPDLGLYYNRARYLNPNTGRFWTMDTYEGDQEDPLSLHKYLYGADDPVNNSDPSGNDYGDFDINIGSILAPLSSVLYANTSASGLNFISGLGAFAPTELVDVYTWRMPLLKMAIKHRAGHVMMTLHNVTTGYPLLSQWPSTQQNTPDGQYGFIATGKGYNSIWDFNLTRTTENGPPTHIFEVSIPGTEVQAFNTAVAEQRGVEYWDTFPNPAKNETQCSTAVCYALEQAGIVPLTAWTSGLMLPNTFDLLMMNETRKPGSGVTLLKTHAFLSSTGN